jgi:hypothetical protein
MITFLIKDEIIPAIVREGLQGCETLRLQHFLYNWFEDGGEIGSLMRPALTTSREIAINILLL